MDKILVIAAHPDDEVLGCGGTIAKHAQNGDEVHVLIVAEGATSRQQTRSRENAAEVLEGLGIAATRAAKILGVSHLEMLDFPDNRLDSVPMLDLVKSMESRISALQPKLIYTHHGADLNVDHRCIQRAVMTACRPQPGQSVRRVLFFEVPSATGWMAANQSDFTPNWYEDVSQTLVLKLEALKAYASEMRPWPHARSYEALEHLARWRGASVGIEAAEAFELGRLVQ